MSPWIAGKMVVHIFVQVLVFRCGADRLPPWTRTHIRPSHPPGWPGLAAVVDELVALAAQDPDRLPDGVLAARARQLRQLVDRLEGLLAGELAVVDARGAAGAEEGIQAPSTASWLRTRSRMGAGAAHRVVRTARAVFRGPLTQTAQAFTDGSVSRPMRRCWLMAPTTSPPTPPPRPNRSCWRPPASWTHPSCGGPWAICAWWLILTASPTGSSNATTGAGLWISNLRGHGRPARAPGPEAGQTLLAALEPLARPANAEDTRSGSQRRADALAELARRNLEAGRLPQTGGVRPQLLVTIDLDCLLGRPGAMGGDGGWTGPLDPRRAGGWPVTPRSPGCS